MTARGTGLTSLAALFWRIADPDSRRALIGLIALSVLVALLELALLAGIFGFIRILIHPGGMLPLIGLRLDESALPLAAAGLLGISLVRALLQYRLIVSRNALMSLWATALLRRLFSLQLDMPWTSAGARDVARSATLMTDDLRATFRHVLAPSLEIATDAAVALFIIGGLLAYDPLLAIGLGATFLGSSRAMAWLEKRIMAAAMRAGAGRDVMPEILSLTALALSSLKEVRVMGRVPGFRAKMRGVAIRYGRAIGHEGMRGMLSRSGNEAALFLALFAAMLFTVHMGHAGAGLLPTFALFGSGGWRLLPVFNRITRAAAEVRENADGAFAALTAIDAADPGPGRHFAGMTGFSDTIRIEGLACGYGDGVPVVQDVRCTVRAGSRIAITGRSGAGKTTFLDTLLGLLPPLGGTVAVDGRILPLAEGGPSCWGRLVGYVPQDPLIANETLRENMLFGTPWPGDDALWQLLEIVGLADLVRSTPHGLDTRMGERGMRFSGGQRQRLCIARALIGDPAILILDEGTAQIDMDSESRLFAALEAARPGLTMLVVTHRPDTAARCDQRIHIDDSGRATIEQPIMARRTIPTSSRSDALSR
ncbi:ATP-binding cassette domain-containing protein [Flavisphingomonas formosensis]|uniref:ATP-binding cassette domain-containing protein n=1 Tax=Flavisphingomonas formosensis TaxID=861534 RepID=UPI0012FCFCC0|nr:ATP-binding cassette domain-containing protein [Sphingomonas formosensis]